MLLVELKIIILGILLIKFFKMQNKAKFIPLSDKQGNIFTGWIIDNSEPWMIPYANTPYARNFRVNWRGISIAPWFYQFWDSLTGSDYPRGIWAYYRSVIANDRIVVRYNIDSTHKLASVNPSTWAQTSITTASNITSDNRMNFISGNDSLYCMNWVDSMGKLNWTTYTVPSIGISLKPAFWAFFDNSFFVAGDPSVPNNLYKSEENNPESFTWTGSDVFTSSYPIVWLASAAQTLYVFSENTIDMINNNSIKQIGSSLVYTSIPLEANEWAMNHNCIAVFWRDVYFLSKSLKIKQIAPNSVLHYDIKELSHRANSWINKTMELLDSDQSSAFCYVIPEQQLIKWFVKSKGSSFNDLCIIYNTEYDQFLCDTNRAFYGWVNYKTQNFTISQVEPKIYKDEYGSTNDDTAIQFTYRTKVMTLWTPTLNKLLRQLRTYLWLNQIWEVYQNVYADWGLIDSKLIDWTTIPTPSGWIATKAIWTYAIWTEWLEGNLNDTLYNTTIVRDKGYLRVKAKEFYVEYVSYKLWTQLLLQNLEAQVEQLHYLDTPHY